MSCDCTNLEQLEEKIKQHEQTIVQLVEMIGTINQKVFELTNKTIEQNEVGSTHRNIFS